ncbi:MAG: hypothetical protein K2H52_17165 [Lachnospiraceae bacterium]|nr:hypothetical protein [Lachnospiraceae bacterium]MDE6184397.1 hypothetical protein [Lachnospiraceae bacterium]MDE7286499.1 hypothetical protein [Lachnospiraceae bacterium]
MEAEKCMPDMVTLVQKFAPKIPIAITRDIGHGTDAKAVLIGRKLSIASTAQTF